MHARTAEIIEPSLADIKRLRAQNELRHYIALSDELAKELEPMGRKQRKNTMRNKPCVCGSLIKFKKCCWSKYE